MKTFLKKEFQKFQHTGLSCLVCGVDSKPVLTFFLWLIGAGVVGSVCFLVWGTLTGKFSTDEKSSMIPLEVEKIE